MSNSQYVLKRNKLIPIAEQHAREIAGTQPRTNRNAWSLAWDKAFHTKMDELAKETGLTNF